MIISVPTCQLTIQSEAPSVDVRPTFEYEYKVIQREIGSNIVWVDFARGPPQLKQKSG